MKLLALAASALALAGSVVAQPEAVRFGTVDVTRRPLSLDRPSRSTTTRRSRSSRGTTPLTSICTFRAPMPTALSSLST
ncbi:hypothetical protein PsYK624_094510 [Phanerochaete sordida]|uniref:Uncharacterized protein n=1 Tax=Phanerochaete sordida TaxID=48140 RepID=A0A9P3GCM6_9APHY|nr:hypothetical protein PsYK624_094510 [Phanerochaete sordida]